MNEQDFALLLPDDSELTVWQQCIKKALLKVQKDRVHFHWPKKKTDPNRHSGCTKNQFFNGKQVMKAGNPPGSYCCGAVMEVFIEAWKLYAAENINQMNLSYLQMLEMYRYIFLFETDDQRYAEGGPAGLEYIANSLGWFTVERSTQTEGIPFGALLQMRFEPDPFGAGHAAIVLGDAKLEGVDVFVVWSSNFGYKQIISKVDGEFQFTKADDLPTGNGPDYFKKEKIHKLEDGTEFKRQFFAGWIVEP